LDQAPVLIVGSAGSDDDRRPGRTRRRMDRRPPLYGPGNPHRQPQSQKETDTNESSVTIEAIGV
jgi:hypothetical protein